MAKQFVFRAETALTLRRRAEDAAVRDLTSAQAREDAARAALDNASGRLEAMLQRGAAEERRPGDVTVRVWYRNWIHGQRQIVDRHRRAHEAASLETQQAALRAQQARRHRKALERLRERAVEKWRLALDHEEQQMVDELSAAKHVHRASGGNS